MIDDATHSLTHCAVSLSAVCVRVVTTEPPVGDASDAFKDRRPNTAPLVGGLLGNTIADMAIYHKEEQGDDEGQCISSWRSWRVG